MFPIRDHNPSGKTPFVAYGLMAANIIIFLSYFSLPSNELTAFFCANGLIPAEVSSSLGIIDQQALQAALSSLSEAPLCAPSTTTFSQVDGVLYSMFLHAGWLHLLGNMLFLFIFGDNLEDFFGHIGFLLFYLLGGLGASALHIAIDPVSVVPTIGASGAIAAVMGGYLLLYPKARVDVLITLGWFINIIALPAWAMLGVWVGLEVIRGVANLDATGGGVAYWAHVGGFVTGVLMVFIAQMGGRKPARVDGHPDHPTPQYRIRRKGPWG